MTKPATITLPPEAMEVASALTKAWLEVAGERGATLEDLARAGFPDPTAYFAAAAHLGAALLGSLTVVH